MECELELARSTGKKGTWAEDKGPTKAGRSGTYDGHAWFTEYNFAVTAANVGERCWRQNKQGLKTMLMCLDFTTQATVKAFQAWCRNDPICV